MKNYDTLFLFIIIAVGCGSLDPPQNGIIVLSGVSVGDTATYNCKHGFQLIGPGTRVCQANGQWSDEAPTCSCRFYAKTYFKYIYASSNF